jgi:hypothetical protein
VEGSCEHGDEPSGSIECWEVLEYLRDWRLRKKRLNSMELVGIEIIRMGADKSLAFPVSYFTICSTTKRIFLGWVKEVRTRKP